MNKDEMVEEMAKITNFTAFDYRQGTIQSKTIYTAMATALYNAGYRKVADDEMVLDKNGYYEHINAVQECGKRMGYAQGRDETAREILQEMYDYCKEDVFGQVIVDFNCLETIARKYDIELE